METARNAGPTVKVLTCTPDPLKTISLAAGTCYGKHDISEKRVFNCLRAGHESVLEHASATFDIGDVSRACTHQLVRHRLASYSQQSQRYSRVDVNRNDWYVIPPDILEDDYKRIPYERMMHQYAEQYKWAWDSGLRAEDARYLLPEACKTEIVVSMNAREFFHFLDTRLSHRAQWEIRYLAEAMKGVLAAQNDEWKKLVEMYERVRTEREE